MAVSRLLSSITSCSAQTRTSAALFTLGAGAALAGTMMDPVTQRVCYAVGGFITAVGAQIYAHRKEELTGALCSSLSLASVGVSLWPGTNSPVNADVVGLRVVLLSAGACITGSMINRLIMGPSVMPAAPRTRAPA